MSLKIIRHKAIRVPQFRNKNVELNLKYRVYTRAIAQTVPSDT